MVPNIATRGTSFVGASKYYLHDKKREGEKSRTTTERVEWTHTRNVMFDDPKGAINVMHATAEAKENLKRSAGVALTGNKSKGDVMTFSLSWSPEEHGQIDKAEMLRAVDTSLKALGAQDHQAVVVAHNDEPHPHCHVILNLVNPINGKNLQQSYTRKKLDTWAYEYRKERGEDKKYCPDRTKKHEAIEARKRGEKPEFVKGTKAQFNKSAFASDVKETAKVASVKDIENLKTTQKEKDAELSKFGKTQAQAHKAEWSVLSHNYSQHKAKILKEIKAEKKRVKDEIFEQGKPYYSEMKKAQDAELNAFNLREKRVMGKLNNMVSAIVHTRRLGREENKNVVAKMFSTLSSKEERKKWIEAKHSKQIKEFKRDQKAQTTTATDNINNRQKTRLKSAYEGFGRNREMLIDKQKGENQDLKDRWNLRGVERKQALKTLKKTTLKREEATNTMKDEEAEKEKTRKAETAERPKRTRKARSRKRTRE